MRQHKKEEKKPKSAGGPGMYHKEQSWQVPIPKFSSGTQRKTFLDDVQRWSKDLPSANTYRPMLSNRVPLTNALCKAEGVTYLSDAQFIGENLPGPNAYKIQET